MPEGHAATRPPCCRISPSSRSRIPRAAPSPTPASRTSCSPPSSSVASQRICCSDLPLKQPSAVQDEPASPKPEAHCPCHPPPARRCPCHRDRTRDVEGQRGADRMNLWGRRRIKKTIKQKSA